MIDGDGHSPFDTPLGDAPETLREQYAYDGAGNRTGLTNGWGRVESAYDRAGRLIRTGERRYEYDGVGNLIGETCRGVHTVYTYNGSNRMTERRHNTGSLLGVCDEDRPNTVRTGYDALGRRVWRTEEPYSGTPRKATYLYDGRGFDLVGETDQDLSSRMVENDLAKDLMNAGGRGRSRMGGGATASGGRRWVAEHLQVGVRPVRSADLVDIPAIIGGVEHKEYYAPDVLGSFGYTEKAQDGATGLMDYGLRDYAPRTARFTTVDPIRDGTNWYAYVGNDPVNKVDRWGLRGVWEDVKEGFKKEVLDPIKNALIEGAAGYVVDHLNEYLENESQKPSPLDDEIEEIEDAWDELRDIFDELQETLDDQNAFDETKENWDNLKDTIES